jgi:hypothetical protein
MLRNTNDLENYAIRATDGEIGHIRDLYFDDQNWVVRYLVAQADFWLSNRRVLISPLSVSGPDWAGKTLPVSIDKAQVSKSPSIDAAMPPSRQSELQYYHYYGYPYYWSETGQAGQGLQPDALAQHADPQLCSCAAVTGYQLRATDGDCGKVTGFLLDESSWAIRYLVVDTGSWRMDHQVLLAPSRITAVQRQDKTVSVDLSCDAVKDLPAYAPDARMDRAWERNLH